ncbi:ASCH domain containing protein [Parasponia andersonii]|uniref:ASCH domain containing protein n=1 Tax=Parasponia andersonii TaxID=3476 RepID=A0A2P5CR77_PARAD|nr:ASCH domain containing protein [Parasponia andersonii]
MVELRNCMEELLKFTLESNTDLGFSPDLLLPSHSQTTGAEAPYPLYKRLASVLCECIESGGLCGTYDELALCNSEKKIKEEWNELMLDKGLELVNILKTVDFELHVQEPFFTQLRDGIKTIEGRCAVGDYNRIGSGSLILFNKCLLLEVQEVRWYASFYEMLKAESLVKVLPGVKAIEEGVQVYRKFYSEEKENYNGVLAICVRKPTSHLYVPLAQILSVSMLLLPYYYYSENN